MTKENLKNMAIHCNTLSEAIEVCKLADRLGWRWKDGGSYIKCNCFSVYESDTCYDFYDGTYAKYAYMKNNMRDIRPAKWFLDNFKINKTMSTFNIETDLKPGMVIKTKNGNLHVIFPTQSGLAIIGYNNSIWNPINKTNVKSHIESIFGKIDKIYDLNNNSILESGKILWNYNDNVIEITIEEIAQIKGVDVSQIKIVK